MNYISNRNITTCTEKQMLITSAQIKCALKRLLHASLIDQTGYACSHCYTMWIGQVASVVLVVRVNVTQTLSNIKLLSLDQNSGKACRL